MCTPIHNCYIQLATWICQGGFLEVTSTDMSYGFGVSDWHVDIITSVHHYTLCSDVHIVHQYITSHDEQMCGGPKAEDKHNVQHNPKKKTHSRWSFSCGLTSWDFFWHCNLNERHVQQVVLVISHAPFPRLQMILSFSFSLQLLLCFWWQNQEHKRAQTLNPQLCQSATTLTCLLVQLAAWDSAQDTLDHM